MIYFHVETGQRYSSSLSHKLHVSWSCAGWFLLLSLAYCFRLGQDTETWVLPQLWLIQFCRPGQIQQWKLLPLLPHPHKVKAKPFIGVCKLCIECWDLAKRLSLAAKPAEEVSYYSLTTNSQASSILWPSGVFQQKCLWVCAINSVTEGSRLKITPLKAINHLTILPTPCHSLESLGERDSRVLQAHNYVAMGTELRRETWPLSDRNLKKTVLDAECQHKSPST